ncbi:MAG: heavy metal-responsive transcriptional regulator [Kofleriaceae bacterium]
MRIKRAAEGSLHLDPTPEARPGCTWTSLQVYGSTMPTGGPLKIGDVAKLAELSVDAVRFYEREGLLGRVRRSAAGQREFDAEAVRRLAFVRRAIRLGFSLAEVKSLLGLRVSTGKPCERVRERARSKVEDIDRRITELTSMRTALSRVIDKCEDTCAPGACGFLDELAQPFDKH